MQITASGTDNRKRMFNNFMVIPNVIALFALSGLVVNEIKENGKKSAVDTPNVPLSNFEK